MYFWETPHRKNVYYTYIFDGAKTQEDGGWIDGGMGGFLSGNNITLWLHLASWDFPNFQISLKSKMDLSVAIMVKTSLAPLVSNSLFSWSR